MAWWTISDYHIGVTQMFNNYNDIHEDHVLVAVPMSGLYERNKIFNIRTFGPTLHVQLDLHVHKNYRLMRIYNTCNFESVSQYYYDELERPWIDIPVDCLNLGIGLHTYTLEFINLTTGDTFYQYFNYTIQNDKPKKPYIYMKRC